MPLKSTWTAGTMRAAAMAGRANVKPDDVPLIAPRFSLQWEVRQQAYVLVHPEGTVKLSAIAAEILRRIDGATPVSGIIHSLEQAYPGADLHADVRDFLNTARERGWIRTPRS